MSSDVFKGAGQGPVLALLGPTAVGKTDLALTLAERWPLDVVNMDSAQVYLGMDIGTAKPDAAVRARAPHHLFDYIDPAEPYSTGRYLSDVRAAIQTIWQAGRIPLLVGGTVLYLRALRDGLAPLPSADPFVRAELSLRAAQVGWPALHAELALADPQAGARIHPHDGQRIQRALEVLKLTGTPLTQHWEGAARSGFVLHAVALMPAERAWLHRRIGQRLQAMFEAGFVAEVARLRERGDLHADLPALRAVGYRQVWAFLEGKLDESMLFDSVLRATCQFAKRQLTAMRPLPDVRHVEADGPMVTKRTIDHFDAVLNQADERG